MEEGHVNNLLSTSARFTSDDDIQRMTSLGFVDKGTEGTRRIFSPPNDVTRSDTEKIPFLIIEYRREDQILFRVFIKRGMCFCSEYHWDTYNGGDWSKIVWDSAVDIPDWPQPEPKTEEMLQEEHRRLEQHRIKVAEARERLSTTEGRARFLDGLLVMHANIMEAANREVVQLLTENDKSKK